MLFIFILSVLIAVYGYKRLEVALKARGRSALYLNRILFSLDEIVETSDGQKRVHLKYEDYRAQHLYKVLQAQEGEKFKGGIKNVGMTDVAKIESMDDTGERMTVNMRDKNIAKHALKAKEPMKSVNKDSGGETFITVNLGPASSLRCNEVPRVDLILACPRPIRLERLLPVIACMGVGRLILVGASKVEKSYWGTQLFRRPQTVQNYLEEGLSQACYDYRVPQLVIERRLDHMMDAMDTFFPLEQYSRVLAHPPRPSDAAAVPGDDDLVPVRMTQLAPLEGDKKRVVVAVGPEGGWTALELQRFLSSSFLPIHAGERVLRTDIAVPALLALAHEYVDLSSSSGGD